MDDIIDDRIIVLESIKKEMTAATPGETCFRF